MRPVDGARLLELEPELAGDLDEDQAAQAARLLVVPEFELPTGAVEIDEIRDSPDVSGAWGLYVRSGLLLNEVHVHGRTCIRLFAPGDLMLLDGPVDDVLPIKIEWRTRERTRVAVLEDRLLAAGKRWPGLMRAVHRRAALVARQELIHRAISQLPRVEDRLLAFLWNFAEGRGRVRTDGVWVELPVTHDELGKLIGAQRSTVSLGLATLEDEQGVRRDDHGVLLPHESLQVFESALEGDAEPAR